MKRWTTAGAFLGALLAAAVNAEAQRSQEELKKKLEDKLSQGWIKKADWITDYDKAREKAEASDKIIFAYFTRSYAY